MHRNEGGEEALHSLQGVDGLLLHLTLLQVMVTNPALLLDPREAIILTHIDQEGSILIPTWKRSQKIAPKFREGGKNVSFLTYDGTYGDTDKILAFIQQFDAAFGGENFQEASKLRHVAMYLTKSGKQWWASLKT